MDIETCIRNYLTSGEFNHEAYHPARDFLSGLLDITIVKPVIEFFTGTDLITGERLTEAQKYQKMAGAIVDMFTFGQGLAAMKGAGLVGKELCKAFGKTMLVEVASSASAYTVGYGVEAMGLPPQIAWMLGAATGCIVSTAGMNLVFRNPKTGVVRECSLEEITSLEKLDASEIDIAKLGKEVPTDDLELYMRYQKEGSIEHFTDSEKKTISRIETMGIKGDECEEILRARGKEVTRSPIEEPEKVLPPKNESEGKGSSSKSKWWHEGYVDDLSDSQMILGVKQSDKGLSTLGSATRENAMSAGKAWVGDNYNVIKDHSGNILGYSSADGMRAFRIQYKPKEGMWRANFQENIMVNNPYPNPGQHSAQLKNVHIDILD